MKSRGVYETPGRHDPARRAPRSGVAHDGPRGDAPARLAHPALRRAGLLRLLVRARARGAAGGDRRGQKNVTGTVRLKLYKGNVSVVGRRAERSLFDPGIASFEEAGGYHQADATGFISLNGLRLRTRKLQAGLTRGRHSQQVVLYRRIREQEDTEAAAPCAPHASQPCEVNAADAIAPAPVGSRNDADAATRGRARLGLDFYGLTIEVVADSPASPNGCAGTSASSPAATWRRPNSVSRSTRHLRRRLSQPYLPARRRRERVSFTDGSTTYVDYFGRGRRHLRSLVRRCVVHSRTPTRTRDRAWLHRALEGRR